MQLLEEKRDLVEGMAQALLKKEVLGTGGAAGCSASAAHHTTVLPCIWISFVVSALYVPPQLSLCACRHAQPRLQLRGKLSCCSPRFLLHPDTAITHTATPLPHPSTHRRGP